MLSRIFIRRRELTQFIRKTGPDRTTSGAQNPERLRSADHTTRHFGGLDWDLNTHRSTQQLIGRIGIGTINSNNFKGPVQSDWNVDPGLYNFVPLSTRATIHSQESRPLFSFSPAQRRNYYLLFFFFSPQK
jgi:hypothetical protein